MKTKSSDLIFRSLGISFISKCVRKCTSLNEEELKMEDFEFPLPYNPSALIFTRKLLGYQVLCWVYTVRWGNSWDWTDNTRLGYKASALFA